MKEHNNPDPMVKHIGESVLRQVKGEYATDVKQADAVMNIAGTLIVHVINSVVRHYGESPARELFQNSVVEMEQLIFDGSNNEQYDNGENNE